jgi:hypothetical protein
MNPINLKIEKQHHLTIMLLIKYEMLKCNSKHAVLFRYSSTMLLEKSILWEIEKAMKAGVILLIPGKANFITRYFIRNKKFSYIITNVLSF